LETALVGPGTAYAITRVNIGQSNDRLLIAFATRDGIAAYYVAAGNVRPMSAEETDIFVASKKNSAQFFYQEDKSIPLIELSFELVEITESAPEPSFTPEPIMMSSLGLPGSFQLMSLDDIIVQYDFDLYSEALAHTDVVVDLTDLQDVTFTGISGLVENTDYEILETSVAIKTSYLSALAVGSHQLTLDFSGSQQVTIEITVADTTPVFSVTPTAAVFNLQDGSPHNADISFALTMANTAFVGIQDMTEGAGYTVSDNTVTVSKDALDLLAPGENLLNFVFTHGGTCPVTVTVYDGSNTDALSPSSAVFDYAVPGDINVSMQLAGCTFTGIEGLTEGDDYTFAGDTVTLAQAYLKTLAPGQYDLTFTLDCGDNILFSLTVTDSVPVVQLQSSSAVYDKYEGGGLYHDAIHVGVLTLENPLAGILGLPTFPHADTIIIDPNEDIRKEIILSMSELDSLEIGEHTLYLVYEGPRFVPLTVTIMDSTPILYVDGVSVNAGSGEGWSYADSLLQITASGLTVSGGSDTASIQVAASVTGLTVCDLQLKSGNITLQSGSTDALALTLTGTSNINGHVLSGGSLQIYGDGSLDVTSTDGSAIKAGSITMQGGTVTVTGNNTQANVPGYGMDASSGNIVVSGGTLTATGRSTNTNISYCGGINTTGSIIITGGTVTAICDDAVNGEGIRAHSGGISISGGTVSATGNCSSYGYGFNSNYVTISGGLVTATGEGGVYGNGITSSGLVNITGGTVTAQGIGQSSSGIDGNNDITISNSTVNASGISAGYDSIGIEALRDIRIDSGVVNAQGNSVGGTAYGLYAYQNCMINGGNVTANGTGNYAYGIHARNNTVTGGYVTAIGSDGDVGIGIYAYLGNVSIEGGNVTSRGTGSLQGYGISFAVSFAVSGAGTYMDSFGTFAAFNKITITADGLPVNVTGKHRVIYENEELKLLNPPNSLLIDGTTYNQADLIKDIAGDGWEWDWLANELTLRGYHSSQIICENTTPLNLILADGTENTVTGDNGRAIQASDLVILGSGSLTATGTGSGGSYGYGIYADDVTIHSGAITAIGNANVGDSNTAYGIYALGGSITVSGGTVSAIANASDYGYGLYASNLSILGGSVATSSRGLKSCYSTCSNGDILITGGTLVANISSGNGHAIYAADDLEVSGGTVTAVSTDGVLISDDITINGGVITASGDFGLYSSSSVFINGGTVVARGQYGIYASEIVIGGTAFVDSVGDLSAFGPAIINAGGQQADTTGWKYALYEGGVLRQAQGPSGLTIGGTTYGPSALIKGISKADWSWDWESKQLTLKGYNGRKISYDGPVLNLMLAGDTENSTVNDSGPGITAPSIIVSGKGKLTVDGDSSYGYGLYATSGSITILDGEITAGGYYGGLCSSSGDIIISGGTVEASVRTNDSAIFAHNGSIAIHGGIVTASGKRGYSDSHGINAYQGNFTMDGGTVIASGECGVRTDSGNILISGGTLTASGYDPSSWSRGYGIHANTGNITIQGGVVVSNGTHRSIYTTAGDITINGGSVKAYGEGFRGLSADSGSVYINHGTVLICVTSAYNAYGIQASSSIIISGSDTLVKTAASTAAFSKDIITVCGQPTNVSGMKQAVYRNGAISGLNVPNNLTIGGESHPADELLESDISGDGWDWNCEASLLTLSGYDDGKIVSTGPAVLHIALKDNTQSNVFNPEDNGIAIRAASVEIGGSGSLAVHGSFAGIYADDIIAFTGTQARIRAWGMNALAASTKTANGNPVYMEESWGHALYENGVLKKIDTPSRLDIGDSSYSQDELFEDILGTGWSWDWETAQLKFSGYHGGYIECFWTPSLHVVLEEGTQNTLSGIWIVGTLSISGNGSLKVGSLQTSGYPITITDSVVLTEPYNTINLADQGGLCFTGINNVYTLESNATIKKNLTLPAGNKYIIPAGCKVTIAQGATLTVNGELVNNGTITGNIIAGNGNSSKISFVSLVPSSKTIYVNNSFTPAVAITPSYAANKQVTWTSSNTAVALVSSTGLVTGKKAGTATIRATAKDGSGAYGQCTVTVKQFVTQLNLNSTSALIIPGKTYTLAATALPSDASDKQVTWSSSNTAVAKVSASGVVTGVSLGKASITATTKDGSNKKASCTVTVVPPVTGIKLNLSKITIGVGQAATTVKANVTADSSSNKAVLWSSSNASIAAVDASGKITGIKAGTATITATAADGSGKSSSVSVTVVASGKGVTGLQLSSSSATVYENKTLTLNAIFIPASPADKTIIWASSNTSVAEVSTNGVVTGVKEGKAAIIATSSSGITAKCDILVAPVPVSSLSINKSSVTLQDGASYQLIATVAPADAKNKTLVWSSSNNAVAVVTSSGMVSAKGVGMATITAKSVNGITAACLVTVNPVPISKLTLNMTKATIIIGMGDSLGKKLTLVPVILPSNASIKALTWTTSNSMVATVDQNGVVTSTGYGKATITATAKDGSRKSAKCSVTVSEVKVSKVTMNTSKATITIAKGESLGKKVTLYASVAPANTHISALSWTTSNNMVATVDQNGVVTSTGYGKATITATAKDGSKKSAKCSITVVAVKVSAIKIMGASTMAVGGKQRLLLQISPSNAMNSSVTWTSSNKKVATVDTQGNVISVGKGTVTITAAANDGSRKKATFKIKVI
jgi:uncharacterized protein YjdB